MSRIKICHEGSYYRLSANPISFDHLSHTLSTLLSLPTSSLYYLDTSLKPQLLTNASEYQSFLDSSSSDLILYTEEPSAEYAEYEDLKQSIVLNPDKQLLNIIRDEIKASRPSRVIHAGVQCKLCKVFPIEGHRYFCKQCKFSVCEKCEGAEDHMHPFLKIKKPVACEEPRLPVLADRMQPRPIHQAEPKPTGNVDIPKNVRFNEPPKVQAVPLPLMNVKNPVEPEKRHGNVVFSAVKKIKELGFTNDKEIKEALEIARYDVELALNILYKD